MLSDKQGLGCLSQQSRNKTKKTLSTTPLPSEKQKKVTKK
jgi:hypothetical protein